ncbi:MAG TPA: discoidin domain-containing protein [Candidatus Methylomirabilis sp.]
MRYAASVLLLLALTGRVHAQEEAKAGEPHSPRTGPFTLSEDHKHFSMIHAGLTRRGEVFVPVGADRPAPRSLLIGLHGRGSSGAAFQANGLDTYAERLNFVMLYPDAMGAEWEVEVGSAGYGDDIGFLRRLIVEATAAFDLDPGRVYVTGHSMGGFMAYRAGIELSDLVAAVAPVSGGLVAPHGPPPAKEARPVALLHLHAADDRVVTLQGFAGYSLGMEDSLAYWARRNGARTKPTLAKVDGKVREIRYQDGAAPVVGLVYPAGGHTWFPGVSNRVMDFFYDNPPRKARVGFEGVELPPVLYEARALTLQPSVRAHAQALQVDLVASGKVLSSSAAPPYRLRFTPEMLKTYRLHLAAVLSDGTRVVSSEARTLTVVPKNLARNGRASSSSDESAELAAAMANDGNFDTRWGSAFRDDQSLTIDLGTARDVQAVTLFWETARAAAYRIEGSVDGKSWKTLFTQPASQEAIEVNTFPRQRLRWVRLVGEKRATPWGISLWEMMVH